MASCPLLLAWLCILVTAVTSISHPTECQGIFPSGTYVSKFMDKCYAFRHMFGNGYPTADYSCRTYGGTLAKVNTKSINDHLANVLRTNLKVSQYTKYWIGLTDKVTEGKFVWEDGTSAEWLNFKRGEGNYDADILYQRDEDCVKMDGDGYWSDYECATNTTDTGDVEVRFICEFPAQDQKTTPIMTTNSPVSTTTGPSTECKGVFPPGTYVSKFMDKCYAFPKKFGNGYPTAEYSCRTYGGTLAKVNTKSINDHLANVLRTGLKVGQYTKYWIGLTDKVTEGKFVWEDGTSAQWLNFKRGEGNYDADILYQRDEDCVKMDGDGYWSDYECATNTTDTGDVEVRFICEFPAQDQKTTPRMTTKPPLSTTTGCQGVFPPGTYVSKFMDKCYAFRKRFGNGYPTAEYSCRTYGGTLAKVNTKSINDHLANVLRTNLKVGQYTKYWIGLTDKVTEGKFVWEDGTSAQWLNFKRGEGNYDADILYQRDEDCVKMDGDGYWSDYECATNTTDTGDVEVRFICEFPAQDQKTTPRMTSKPPVSTTTGPSTECKGVFPPGTYVSKFMDKCYAFPKKFGNGYPTAEYSCRTYGGTLAKVNTKRINDHLANVLRTNLKVGQYTKYWIGLTDKVTEGKFVWEDGTSAQWLNFKRGEGNYDADILYQRDEDCVKMDGDGYWSDYECATNTTDTGDVEVRFICEFPAQDQKTTPRMTTTTESTEIRRSKECSESFPPTVFVTKFMGKCYAYNSMFGNGYPAAKTSCGGFGATLAKVNTMAINQHIATVMKNVLKVGEYSRFWIGLKLKHSGTKRNYFWDDGEQASFQNFKDGQGPKGTYQSGQDCVRMDRDGFWHDSECAYNILYQEDAFIRFVCELPVPDPSKTTTTLPPSSLPTTAPMIAAPGCEMIFPPHAYVARFKDRCYAFDRKYGSSYATPSRGCHRYGARLAKVNNREINDFLASSLKNVMSASEHSRYWIGLNDQAAEGRFVWPDGERMTFERFKHGEGINHSSLYRQDREDCVKMDRDGYWHDDECTVLGPVDVLMNYICDFPASFTDGGHSSSSTTPGYVDPNETTTVDKHLTDGTYGVTTIY